MSLSSGQARSSHTLFVLGSLWGVVRGPRQATREALSQPAPPRPCPAGEQEPSQTGDWDLEGQSVTAALPRQDPRALLRAGPRIWACGAGPVAAGSGSGRVPDGDPDGVGGGRGQDPRGNPISCAARLLWEGLEGAALPAAEASGQHSTATALGGAGDSSPLPRCTCPGCWRPGAPWRTRDSSPGPLALPCHFPAARHSELRGFLLPPAGEKTKATQHPEQPREDSWRHPPYYCEGGGRHPWRGQDTAQVTGASGRPGGGGSEGLGLWGPGEGT